MTGPALPRNRRDPTRLTQEPPDPRQRFAQRALHFPDGITTAPHHPQQILLLDAEPDRTHTHPRLHTSHHRLPAVMHRPAESATVFGTGGVRLRSGRAGAPGRRRPVTPSCRHAPRRASRPHFAKLRPAPAAVSRPARRGRRPRVAKAIRLVRGIEEPEPSGPSYAVRAGIRLCRPAVFCDTVPRK